MTIGDNATGQGQQTVTINNNSNKSDSTCTFSFSAREFNVTGSSNNDSYGTITNSTVLYGSTTTITITPASNYYLSAFRCTNGYTHNANTGVSYTSGQTVTINNNSNIGDTTCSATFSPATYEGTIAYLCPDGTYQTSSSCTSTSATRTLTRTRSCSAASSCYVNKTGSNSWNAKYYCSNGSGSMKECWYGAVGSGTQCGEGYNGSSYWAYMCTLSTSSSHSRRHMCHYTLADNYVKGGGLSETISCSCPSLYSSSIGNSYGTAGICASGYTIGSWSSETCTPSGSSGSSCSSNATCSTIQTAPCTATGTLKYYCSSSGTYQDSSTCYY